MNDIIPPEILGEILAFALPKRVLGIMGRKRLLELGLVSKRWRDTTLESPNLWCGIQVGIEELGNYQRLEDWMKRGRDAPKTLVVVDDWDRNKCAGEGRCPLHSPNFLKILSAGPALSCLKLYGISIQCFVQLMTTLRLPNHKHLSSVRSLQLAFRSSYWPIRGYPLSEALLPFKGGVTSLSLSLPWYSQCDLDRGRTSKLSLGIPPLLLNTLTHLIVDFDWDLGHLTSALRSCANLEALEVDARSKFTFNDSQRLSELTQWQSEDKAIRLPKLHTLHLSGQHPQLFLLRHLITPILHSLDLSFADTSEMLRHLYAGSGWCGYSDDEEDPLDIAAEELARDATLSQPLLPFIERSGCRSTLHYLRIGGQPFRSLEHMELVLTLAGLPSLRRLTLDHISTNYQALWSALNILSLQHLQLEGVEASALTPSALQELVKLLQRLSAVQRIYLTVSVPDTSSFSSDSLVSLCSTGRASVAVVKEPSPDDASERLDELSPRPRIEYGSFFD
ncbi:hypothetical protein NMY22_g19140 [Coprinellus aureogranulatus]|nr:hypothetical protein NMY22_g19140 [Coprinellus aureogranulatus]